MNSQSIDAELREHAIERIEPPPRSSLPAKEASMTSPLDRFTPQRAVALFVFATIAATAIVAARRDLAGRQPSQVRGNYELWRRLTWLPGPSIAYLVAGRKPRDTSQLDTATT